MEDQLETLHRIIMGDARNMAETPDESIDLVVTSPPYPMIQMWDDLFSEQDASIAKALSQSDTRTAFEGMHRQLNSVWDEVMRVLKPGGIACINIGDATRSFDGHFQLFANHAAVISHFTGQGFSQLPMIIWRKSTNAPNKFMGSGMLPPGAYVTLEHEYILIFRKGAKRQFSMPEEKSERRRSAYFWEERNAWFSDVWTDLQGVLQKLENGGNRQRSAAFPLELPYRLICMFSLKGQTVLDPFLGTGTSMLAAMCTARQSIGYESDASLRATILEKVSDVPDLANRIIEERLEAHRRFILERTRTKGHLKHQNRCYDFPVMTRQEEDLRLDLVRHVQYQSESRIKIVHAANKAPTSPTEPDIDRQPSKPLQRKPAKGRQLKLF